MYLTSLPSCPEPPSAGLLLHLGYVLFSEGINLIQTKISLILFNIFRKRINRIMVLYSLEVPLLRLAIGPIKTANAWTNHQVRGGYKQTQFVKCHCTQETHLHKMATPGVDLKKLQLVGWSNNKQGLSIYPENGGYRWSKTRERTTA
jgi:hypothetical protein